MKEIIAQTNEDGSELHFDLVCDCGWPNFTDEESGQNYAFLSVRALDFGSGKVRIIKCDKCGDRYEVRQLTARRVKIKKLAEGSLISTDKRALEIKSGALILLSLSVFNLPF